MYTQSTNSVIQRATFLQEFSFFPTTQNLLNVRTIKHKPAQVDDFIRTDIKNFPEATGSGIV